ncbi:alpha-E domain-containing protein [Curtobacterium sp. 'Ferrero']|uniref:alpha-E domain-containing protein n=1 Tax=Curtobacterium sp. 'Ferrero' TaxID=2033654 RepID=UPI001144959D|nr:alpha-E domain-containing protein [Curtobacterium sp. 'Ferrero']
MSHLAGSVFRLGAALEHTDLVARLLDVYVVRPSASVPAGHARTASLLRSVVGASDARDADPAATLDALALDRHEPASIAHAVAVARDAARRAREVVSTELWDCLDVTRSRMPRKVGGDRAHDFLGWAKERSALAVGVVDGDASRDDVWAFFTLGRSLSRVRTTSALLSSGLLDPSSPEAWSDALRGCGAAEAFRRGAHHDVDPSEAAAFLLLDTHSPRTVAFLAHRAVDGLERVTAACVADEVAAFRRAVAALDAVAPQEVLAGLRAVTTRLADAGKAVDAALEARVFSVASAVS